MADPGGPSGAVAEITITAGTGSYQLGTGPPIGPLAQYFRFADVFLDGELITYEVDDTAKKEIVRGRFDLGGNTLSRDIVLFSSNGNALIDWPPTGQRTVRPLVAFPLCDTPPTDGQVLAWDAALEEYCPITLTDDDSGGGGGGGSFPLCATPPTDGQILVWNGTEWCPADLCALVDACINPPPPVGTATLVAGGNYSTRGPLSGVGDSATGTISYWVKDFTGSGNVVLSHFDTAYLFGAIGIFITQTTPTWSVGLLCQPPAPSPGSITGLKHLQFGSQDSMTGLGQIDMTVWNHIMLSWDTNHIAGNKIAQIAINGSYIGAPTVSDPDGAFVCGYSTNIVEWDFLGVETPPYPSFGHTNNPLNAFFYDFWFAPGQFVNLSVGSNITKFRNSTTGAPVDLGIDGSTPTGTAPAIFFHKDCADPIGSDFGINQGTGGVVPIIEMFMGAAGNYTASGTCPP